MNRAAELDALIEVLTVDAYNDEQQTAVTNHAETLVVLAALTDREKAQVLDRLVAQDPALAARAGREGRVVLAAVEIDAVASGVADALLGLDQEELSQHAGRTRYGYVGPTTAAWLLLEAALEPWLGEGIPHRRGRSNVRSFAGWLSLLRGPLGPRLVRRVGAGRVRPNGDAIGR